MNCFWFMPILRMTGVKYGKRLRLDGMPVIFNKRGATLRIGDRVTVKSSFLSNLVGLYSRSIIVTRTKGASILIGDDVGISGATIYARSSITIGDRTLIGGNVKILDNDFHPLDAEARFCGGEEQIAARPIVIGKDCFIGCNSLILKGTVLGDGCVVGAGAVVCGRFESGCVIAGNPARVIRRIGDEHEA